VAPRDLAVRSADHSDDPAVFCGRLGANSCAQHSEVIAHALQVRALCSAPPFFRADRPTHTRICSRSRSRNSSRRRTACFRTAGWLPLVARTPVVTLMSSATKHTRGISAVRHASPCLPVDTRPHTLLPVSWLLLSPSGPVCCVGKVCRLGPGETYASCRADRAVSVAHVLCAGFRLAAERFSACSIRCRWRCHVSIVVDGTDC
jgi:hypothetical protein